jgi:cell division protein FtsW
MTAKWLRFQLWVVVAALCGFGLVMVASTTGTGRDGVTYGCIIKQAGAMALGALVAVVVSAIGVERWRDRRLVALVVLGTIAALVAVLAVGHSAKGATRWINLGPINLQPSELAKFMLVVSAAWYFGGAAEKVRSYFHGVLLPLAGFAVVAALIYLTRDLGSVLVLGLVLTAVLVYAGAPWLYFFAISLAVAPAAIYVAVFQEAYRRDRILAFLDPMSGDGAAYHVRQSLIAIGTGGVFGVGLGESQNGFLPEKHTDFIYAVICQEFGLVGALLLAFAFLVLVITGLMIAANTRELHQRLLAIGAAMALGVQAFWNMLVVTGAVPTKGLTLPFISYGGSSRVVCLALIGILDAVARSAARAQRRTSSSRIGAAVVGGRSWRWQTEP